MISGRRPYDTVKRCLDFLSAGVGLIVLSPVMAVVAVSVAVNLGRPVIFVQDRPGKEGRVFRLYKFRTMKNVDESLGLVTDGSRLTRFGAALRSTSLDELPTLLNVVKGNMSIVGPRPLLVQYLERYSSTQSRRHEVRPGITGLAQVRGRNSVRWDDRLALDVQYVDQRSFVFDGKILWATVRTVINREGISADGHATMSEFAGPWDRGGDER